MADYDFFTAIVAGDEPEKIMAKYDKSICVDRHLMYQFSDRERIKAIAIQNLNALMLNPDNLPLEEYENLRSKRNDILKMTAEEYFFDLVDKFDYDMDPSTNDLYSDENEDAFWSSYTIGKRFSIPFKLLDGTEPYQARKKDIDWNEMNNSRREVYEAAWDLVMGSKEPTNDWEKNIYENMKNRVGYFEKFGYKENYVTQSTAFWGYVFVDENSKYMLEEDMSQYVWVSEFYDRFIVPLHDDTLLTIFECRR